MSVVLGPRDGDQEATPGLGVTSNAQLVLGFVMAAINWRLIEHTYELLDFDAASASFRLRHRGNGNVHRVSVEQTEGSA